MPTRVSGWKHVRALQSFLVLTVSGIQERQIPFLLRVFPLLVHLRSTVPCGTEYIFLSFCFSTISAGRHAAASQEWPQPSTSLFPHGHPFDECSPTLIYHPQIGPNELNTALLNITRFKWIFSLQVCPIIGFIHLVEVQFTLANITPIQATFSAPVTGAGQICHWIITGNSNNN